MEMEMETAIAAAVRDQGPAVVGIDRRSGRGTAVVTAPGVVLTLASNLRDPAAGVGLEIGDRVVVGAVAGIDDALDLAVIRADTGTIVPLVWAPSAPAVDEVGARDPADAGAVGPPAAPVVGQAVIALANPGGQGLRATPGFIAAVERRYRGPRGRVVGGALEHTAPLPRGAGGGPLLDLSGRLLGLNAVRVHGGLILTLPGPAVAERAARLLAAEPDSTPQLGVAVVSPRVARRLRRAVGLPEREGLLIQGVAAGSPAERARLLEGDLIVAAGPAPVDGVDALYAALDRAATDGTIDLQIVRGVDERTVAVELGGSR